MFTEELWLIPKSGRNRGRARFFKKIRVDDTSLLKTNQILHLVNKQGRERNYLIERIEHAIYSVPKDKFDETGTDYYARIFVKRY